MKPRAKKRLLSIVIIVIIAMLPCCALNKFNKCKINVQTPTDKQNTIDNVIFDGYPFHGDETVESVLKSISTPVIIKIRSVENMFISGQIDNVVSIANADVELEFFVGSGDPHKEFIFRATQKTNKHKGNIYIIMGSTRTNVLNILGEPKEREGSTDLYFDQGNNNYIKIEYSNGIVKAMRWELYID